MDRLNAMERLAIADDKTEDLIGLARDAMQDRDAAERVVGEILSRANRRFAESG